MYGCLKDYREDGRGNEVGQKEHQGHDGVDVDRTHVVQPQVAANVFGHCKHLQKLTDYYRVFHVSCGWASKTWTVVLSRTALEQDL